jgi:hypothetical protein
MPGLSECADLHVFAALQLIHAFSLLITGDTAASIAAYEVVLAQSTEAGHDVAR